MDLKTLKQVLAIYCVTTMTAFAFQAPVNFNYNGFYAGLNGGYAYSQSSTKTTTSFVPGSYFLGSDIQQINNSGSKTLSVNNFTGGIEGGYNHLFNRILLGAEADFESLSGSASNSYTVMYLSAPGFSFNMYTKTTTNWLFTLRPRIGYLFTNNTLLYLTGGLAVAQFKIYQSFSDNFAGPIPSGAAENSSKTQNQSGFVVGAGIEYPVAQHVTIKAEYLYSQFGNVNSSGQMTFNPAYLATFIPPMVQPAAFNHSANLSDNMFRLGINYNFA